MIKVSVMYPSSKFDMDYYCTSHMPMVHEKMAGACIRYTVDRGLAGGNPGEPPAYAAVGTLFFDSVAVFQNAFGPHAEVIFADVPNYTDVAPTILISEVVVG